MITFFYERVVLQIQQYKFLYFKYLYLYLIYTFRDHRGPRKHFRQSDPQTHQWLLTTGGRPQSQNFSWLRPKLTPGCGSPLNLTPASSSARRIFAIVSKWAQSEPLEPSMRRIVDMAMPDFTARSFCPQPRRARAAFICCVITSMMQHRYGYEKQSADTARTSKRSKSFAKFSQTALVLYRPDVGARLCRLAGSLE